MQRLTAEEQNRQHHHQRAAVSDDGPRQGTGDRAVDDIGNTCLAHLAEVFPNPIGDDHRLVHRITEHCEHRRQHGQREFPLEQREKAKNDDYVVEVGGDGGNREAPFEAQRKVGDDTDTHQQQRERAVLVELLAHLRAHELHSLLGRAGVVSPKRRHDALG